MPIALLSAQLQVISISLSLISALLPQATQAAVYNIVPEPVIHTSTVATAPQLPKIELYGPRPTFGSLSPEQYQIATHVAAQARVFGVDEYCSMKVAWGESRFDPEVKNPSSTATGLFQFLRGTWKAHCEGDVTDYVDSTACFMKLIVGGGIGHWTADPNAERALGPECISKLTYTTVAP